MNLPDLIPFLHVLPVFGFWSASSSASNSTSNEETNTSSGANSPNASDNAQAVGSGSINLGASAAYQEQGATSTTAGGNIGGQVGGDISAGSGSTITIGDPNATATIASLAQQFAASVQNVAATGEQAVTAAAGVQQPGTISYKTVGIIVAILAAIVGLFALLGRKKS